MKRCFIAAAIAISSVFTVPAADTAVHSARGDSVFLVMLKSRLGENRSQFTNAVRRVAAEAAAGKKLHQLAISALARGFSAEEKKSLGLTDKVLAVYGGAENLSILGKSAERKDNSGAQYIFSLCSTNEQTRLNWLERAAKGNDEQALVELGICCLNRGDSLLREASEASLKNPGRARNMTRQAEASYAKAFGLFRRAADSSDPNGSYNYAYCLVNGIGCAKDPAAALGPLRHAARSGQPQAQNLLGECYRDGIALDRDVDAAVALFRESAKSGCAGGCLNYAFAILRGEGELKDDRKAMSLMRQAAEFRNVRGMYEYAKALLDGIGEELVDEGKLAGPDRDAIKAANDAIREQNRRTAFLYLYHCALRLKHPPSMTLLGDCYRDGTGVAADGRKAVLLYHRAAMDFGHGPAMDRMAECFDLGTGGIAPDHEAALWWRTRERALDGDRCAAIWLNRHDAHRFDTLAAVYGGGR
ncbi:MAG: sel1 repeat family protein [Kiritimatiellae bacterium]|nr:sel1 repeat family protein [Kiritimatiellia bacterium]